MNCLALFFALLGLFCLSTLNATENNSTKYTQSIAFYYGQQLPIQEAAFYPAVVVQANHTKHWQIKWLQARGTKVYAYLSVGESTQMPEGVKTLGINKSWHSHIPDLNSPQWQTHLFKQAETLLQQYDGLFLDTLDSYMLTSQQNHPTQVTALIDIIKHLGQLSNNHLILNRGFDILPHVSDAASTVVAEGLLTYFSPLDNTYTTTSQADQTWLSNQLNRAKKLGFKVQVLDYSQSPAQQLNIAKNIVKQGFLPWVSDGHLKYWGTGTLQTVARKVTVLFDSTDKDFNRISKTKSHRRLDSYLEYLGYIPEYLDTAYMPLHDIDPAITAGIIVWTNDSRFYKPSLVNWLINQLGHTKLLLLGEPPTASKLLHYFGIGLASTAHPPYSVSHIAPQLKSESVVSWQGQDIYEATLISKQANVLLSLQNHNKKEIPQITQSQYGAIALNPWIIDVLPNELSRWYIDPLTLLKQGLQLPPIPAADVTTENGQRILINHIDGDGFPSRSHYPHKKRVSELVYEEILKPYAIPITVSVIEGEVGPSGLYPKEADELQAIARNIFKLPYVEIASHSYSHPFYWPDKHGHLHVSEEDTLYGYHLAIKNYTLDQTREVAGSINYINNTLAPDNKRVKLMLWTGEAIVSKSSLIAARNAGVVNMNGGNSYTNPITKSLSEIWPIGRHVEEDLYQIYAPIMNENVFTHDWTRQFGGFTHVIDTFKRTDTPLRLKPMNIYYHFYSGTYPASLNALKTIYDYALDQQPTLLYLSDYAKRAEDFYNSAIAQDLNGQWLMQSQSLRTLRIPNALGYPLPNNSIAGFNTINNDYYTHISKSNPSFTLSPNKPQKPYLAHANVLIEQWHYQQDHIDTQFRGYTPIKLYIKSEQDCTFTNADKQYLFVNTQNGQKLELAPGHYHGRINCDDSP